MAKNQSRTPGRDVRGGKGKSSAGFRGGKSAAGRKIGKSAGSKGGRIAGSFPGTHKGKKGFGAGGFEPRGSGRDGATRQGGSRTQQAARAKPAPDLIEGRRACTEALECGVPLRRAFVLVASDAQDQTLAGIVDRLEGANVPIERVSRSRLDQMSSHGAHQGIVVQTQPFSYAELSDVIAAAGEGDALIVLLDHVTDEGNFGAIVRSAEVVGAAGVVIAKARAARVGVGAYKTSAGAVLHVPIAQVSNLATAIEQIKDAGFWVAGSTEHAEQDVWEAPMGGRLCLVMGSEGSGISRLVRERCDFECRLPQRGHVESLNVAQATTVMCYEWLRRTQAGQEEA